MPDYGEIFCEAVEEVVKTQLRGLSYDLTQVCQVDDISERDKGIYWVSTDAARFKAYSTLQNYEVGDTVYVTTPNNDSTQQKIIVGKKVIGSQQDITYVMPFNNIKDITGNIVNGFNEVGRLANSNITGHDILIWESNNFETGFTRLGLQGAFRSQVADAVEGSYGLKVVLGTKGTTDEVKDVATFYLDSDDMYGNPYNFDGYYLQQKVFDISALAGFDVIKVYFYQDKDFKDRDGDAINAADSFGNALKSNLFVNDLYICLGYDVKDVYNDGLILYCNDGMLYDMTPQTKTISWRFIQTEKNKKIKLITDADKLPGGYELWLYKYNASAPFSDMAGAGWERIIRNGEYLVNFHNYQFTTDYDLANIKYKALIVYNDRVIYESNILEFINTADVVAAKVDKLMNNFYIHFSDESNGRYEIYENKLASSSASTRNRYLFPAFKNIDNEIEYITGVDRVKWIVPKTNTMINLITPNNMGDMINIELTFPTENYSTLEEYLKEKYFEPYGDNAPNYYIYKDFYYIYFFHPEKENGLDQRIGYTIKQNLNTKYANNEITCHVEHNNQTLKRSTVLFFGEKQIIDNYTVEISFEGEENEFFITDWDDETNTAIKKNVIAKLINSEGQEIDIKDLAINWEWHIPESNSSDQNYNIIFDIFEENNNSKVKIGLKEKLLEVVTHHSILKVIISYQGKDYIGYLPIPLSEETNIIIENIVEEFQENQTYTDLIKIYKNNNSKDLTEYSALISSSYKGTDVYQPDIKDGQIRDISTNIQNLKSLYCYEIFDENQKKIKTVPAFRTQKNLNNDIPITLPIKPLDAITKATTNNDFIINKSDLSSGKLTDNNGSPSYNGLIIGNVSRTKNNENASRYGIYGVQGEKLTFAIEEDGDAYFGGELRGASGTFEGTLNAQEGQIGKWYIKEGALTDSTGQIQLLPITGEDNKPAISIGGLIINAGTILGENAVIDGVDIADSLVQLTAVDGNLQQYITKVDADLEKVENEILKDGDQSVDPNWTSITFIDSIGLSDNGKTINYTIKTVKVLTYGDVTSGQGSFNISE